VYGAGVLAAQVDGHGVFGDADGDNLPGVDPAESDLLADDHDHAGVAGHALDVDRLSGWARGRAVRRSAAQQPGLVPRSAGSAECAAARGCRVEEHHAADAPDSAKTPKVWPEG
jgi:hypothetical protein